MKKESRLTFPFEKKRREEAMKEKKRASPSRISWRREEGKKGYVSNIFVPTQQEEGKKGTGFGEKKGKGCIPLIGGKR